jgi:hypothetical protein
MANKIVVGVLLVGALAFGLEVHQAVYAGRVSGRITDFDDCTFALAGNRPVYQNPGPDFSPVMAEDSKGNLYVAWENQVSATDHDIFQFYFNKPNKKWYPSNPPGLITPARDHRQPFIFFDPYDNSYLMAKGPPPAGFLEPDSTLFWWVRNETLFTMPGLGWEDCSYPMVAANETGIWIAVQVNTAGQSDIRVLYQDYGSSNVYTANVAANPAVEQHPSIAAGTSYAVLAYEYQSGPNEWRVFATRAADQNFSEPAPISGTPGSSERDPFVAASGSNFYIGYTKGKDVWLAHSSDDGGSFANTAVAATQAAERRPAVTGSGSKVYVAYLKDSTQVMHRKSTDGGATWSDAEPVSDNKAVVVDTFRAIGIACHPKDSTHISWVDNRNSNSTGWDIYHALAGEVGSGIVESRSRLPGGLLLKCRPSLFNKSVTIEYILTQAGWVGLQIYDAVGNLISNLDAGNKNPGRFELRWNGCNASGKRQPAGVYFVQLTAAKKNRTERILLMR